MIGATMDLDLPPFPLRRVSTVEALTAALREQILDGALPAGSPLREADISERFGVSRHTVRAALQTLGHEGVVRLAPNRGAVVPDVTADDVADLFALRTALETYAARALASGAGDVQRLRDALDRLHALGLSPSWAAVREADLAFHQALVDALGSARASRAYAPLLAELRLAFLRLRPELADHAAIVRQHRAIYRAIAAGAADKAAALVERHLAQSARDIAAGAPDGDTARTR